MTVPDPEPDPELDPGRMPPSTPEPEPDFAPELDPPEPDAPAPELELAPEPAEPELPEAPPPEPELDDDPELGPELDPGAGFDPNPELVEDPELDGAPEFDPVPEFTSDPELDPEAAAAPGGAAGWEEPQAAARHAAKIPAKVGRIWITSTLLPQKFRCGNGRSRVQRSPRVDWAPLPCPLVRSGRSGRSGTRPPGADRHGLSIPSRADRTTIRARS